MNKKDKIELRRFARKTADRLKVLLEEVNELAEDVEGYVMKRTTQQSNEWNGAANN